MTLIYLFFLVFSFLSSPLADKMCAVLILQIMLDKNMEDNDIEPAPKLIQVVFQNCKGQVDQWVEPYLRITVERLRQAEKSYLKCLLMQVVGSICKLFFTNIQIFLFKDCVSELQFGSFCFLLVCPFLLAGPRLVGAGTWYVEHISLNRINESHCFSFCLLN